MKRLFGSLIFLLGITSLASERLLIKEDVFRLRASPCFGACPQYDFYLFSDNTYVFIGNKFVAHLGVYKGRFGQNEYPKLIALLKEFNFSSFKDQYRAGDKQQCPQILTDHPSMELKLQSNQLNKNLYHYLGCKGFTEESQLLQLEEEIKSLLHIDAFVAKNIPL